MAERTKQPASAWTSLGDVPKPDALAELAHAAVTGDLAGEAVREKAKELSLEGDDGKTPFGDAIEVLARGPEDDAETTLARALGALAIACSGAQSKEPDAALVLRLATKSAFDPSPLLDEALGDRADDWFGAIAEHAVTASRAEALVACAILMSSKRALAKKELASLVASSKEPLVRALGSNGNARSAETHLAGELVSPPRNPALTILLGVTGILFVSSVVRLALRLVLAYRTPAEVSASASGVRIRARTELLGRTLRDREIVIGSEALARVVREVRFPRTGLYAGLIALAVGTYVGVGALVDGVRAASPSLLGWGLLFVALGIALDFALTSVRFGAKGKCRVVLAPRKGGVVCIGDVDPQRADAALASLAQR
ncbi:MAG TPA: hypothetical protein VH054_11080 [Polyangiaceae bacterium]|jgi:hypothetical protein|nr:hypothetical protein [Polyangiaceae bacterium]